MTAPLRILICSVAGCDRKHLAKGYCRSHYERFRRHGDAEGGRASPGNAMAFLLGAVRSETDACLVWPYSVDGGGYGKISINGRLIGVPSEVLSRTGQPKPSAAHVSAHAPLICHTPRCINPRHLRWATTAENMADRALDGTENKGIQHGNAILTDEAVRSIRRARKPVSQLSRDYVVSEATVRDVLSGRTWSHVK